MNDIFELSNDEKLGRVNNALNDRIGRLADLTNEFEQQTSTLRNEIQLLEGIRNDLQAPTEEVVEVSEAAPLEEGQGEG